MKISRFMKPPEFVKRVLDGEITAYYTRCSFHARARAIMGYSNIGQVIDGDGGFCPRVGETVSSFHVDARGYVYARYPSGTFMVNTMPIQRLSFVAEDYADLADYGLPPYTIYRFDNCDNITIRKEDKVKKVEWKTVKEASEARYLIQLESVDILPVLDVTEEQAVAMGFRPTYDPVPLTHNLFLRIDDGATARNAFFIDYYNRAGDELKEDPYIFYYKIKLVRR